MNHCEGWEAPPHKTEQPLRRVYLYGCRYCGGADCGDSGDTIYLCEGCLADLEEDPTTAGQYDLLEEGT